MLIISIIPYELEMTQCDQKPFNLNSQNAFFTKIMFIWSLFTKSSSKLWPVHCQSKQPCGRSTCTSSLCVRFQYTLSCSNINAYSRKNLFANLRIFIRESMRNNYCVKRNWIHKLFFFLNIALVSSFQYIPKLCNFLFKY